MPRTKGSCLSSPTLDHTLLPHDTQASFCNYVLRRRQRWRTLLHGLFIPFALGKAFGLCSTLQAKRAFMGYLWGMPPLARLKYAATLPSNRCSARQLTPITWDEIRAPSRRRPGRPGAQHSQPKLLRA